MENKPRLKDRLARIFWPPSLLRSSAAVSSRSHSAAISSRSLSAAPSTRSFSLAADIAQEPMFIPRLRRSEAEEVNLSLLRRSSSLDRRCRRNFVGCGGCRPNSGAMRKESESKVRESSGFYDSVDRGGEGNGRTCPPTSPSSHSPKNDVQLYHYCFKEGETKKKRKTKKKKNVVKRKQRTRSNRHEQSISSSFGEEGFGFFSSEEAETFFSTRSFSSDSSEFYSRPLSKTRKTGKKTEQIKKKKEKHHEKSYFSSRRRQPRRLSAKSRDNFSNGFQPLVSVSFSEEDEVEKTHHGGGFPVLKKSSDPYSDFRSSMAEMIVERQIFGTRELERLLHSYLSLNSVEIHPAILRAFFDISQVLFSH